MLADWGSVVYELHPLRGVAYGFISASVPLPPDLLPTCWALLIIKKVSELREYPCQQHIPQSGRAGTLKEPVPGFNPCTRVKGTIEHRSYVWAEVYPSVGIMSGLDSAAEQLFQQKKTKVIPLWWPNNNIITPLISSFTDQTIHLLLS